MNELKGTEEKPNLSCYFRNHPIPMPKQKLPTNATPTSHSFNTTKKSPMDAPSRLRAGRKSDKENSTREGKCRGSKQELVQDDDGASKRSNRAKELASLSVLSLPLARLALAMSCDNIPSHSASHFPLFQSGSRTLLVVVRDRSSVARSTSRHRRKRSAASARSDARVAGVRNRPVRRAMMDVGRKDDRV